MNASMVASFMMLLYFGIFWQNRTNVREKENYRSISINGMAFQWKVEGDMLHCKAIAPCKGWIAVGFHTKDQLAGTHLIMGAAEEGFYKMDDRYIVRPGLHKNMLELGVQEALYNKSVTESDNQTTMQFSVPLITTDAYHQDLIPGKTYYVLLAYSLEDDFQHHSIMRTSVSINL